jgi:hypothetical protein
MRIHINICNTDYDTRKLAPVENHRKKTMKITLNQGLALINSPENFFQEMITLPSNNLFKSIEKGILLNLFFEAICFLFKYKEITCKDRK